MEDTDWKILNIFSFEIVNYRLYEAQIEGYRHPKIEALYTINTWISLMSTMYFGNFSIQNIKQDLFFAFCHVIPAT